MQTTRKNIVRALVLVLVLAAAVASVVALVMYTNNGTDYRVSTDNRDRPTVLVDQRDNPAATPDVVTVAGADFPVVESARSAEDLSPGEVMWYDQSADPGSMMHGTVVLFATVPTPVIGDVVAVSTDDGDYNYIISEVYPGVTQGTEEWGSVGSVTFNRTTGQEKLSLMVVTGEGVYDIAVGEPEEVEQ